MSDFEKFLREATAPGSDFQIPGGVYIAANKDGNPFFFPLIAPI